MINFGTWCEIVTTTTKSHTCSVMTVTKLESGVNNVASRTPSHYSKMAEALDALNNPMSAKVIRNLIPTTPRARAADIGELLAAEWIDECSGGYRVPIKRLRWKDHPNMSPRGVDVIGIREDIDNPERVEFIKGEAKCHQYLSSSTISNARNSLDDDEGLPNSATLSYVANRLINDCNEQDLGSKIIFLLTYCNIAVSDVKHLIFTVSSNDPKPIFQSSINSYDGNIDQMYVGTHVKEHKYFIRRIYEEICNA